MTMRRTANDAELLSATSSELLGTSTSCKACANPEPALAPLRTAPAFLVLGAVALYVLSGAGQPGLRSEDVGGSSVRSLQPPPLRGCRGAPAEFRWLAAEGGAADATGTPLESVAGRPIRMKVLALDAQGRRARAHSCQGLLVNLHLGGHARLSSNTSLQSWADGELALDIEDDRAEEVEAELQIEIPGIGFRENLTTRLAQLRFGTGPAREFRIEVRPVSSGWARASQPLVNHSSAKWPTQIVLEAMVSARDELGNPVHASELVTEKSSLALAGSPSLEFLDSRLQLGEYGEVRALLRGVRPGPAELWLSKAARGEGGSLTSARLDFAGAPAVGGAEGARTLSPKDQEWHSAALEVRDAFLHAWRGYRRWAWGADELHPLSKKGHDTFGNIGMTILDSLTTLHLMGLHEEFEQGAEFVDKQLDFDSADREVSVFELNIRALGGLLGAHSLTGRRIFLARAVELADRLLPALNSSSGLPMPRWNIARGGCSAATEPTILAEAGSLQLEFRYLAAATGETRYGHAADACFDAIQSTGVVGLLPVQLTPPDQAPPRALNAKFSVGALADSYYEYLLKQWIQSPAEERFKDMWLMVMDQLPALVMPKPDPHKAGGKVPKFKIMEASAGGGLNYRMEHLSCFAPGMIALGLMSLPASEVDAVRNATWHQLAEGLTASCVELWTSTKSGLQAEFVTIEERPPYDLGPIPVAGKFSFLRPETAESLFYLYRLTGKKKYRKWGKKLFDAIVANGKVEAGFASVADVTRVPTEKVDEMQSFVMAETFKYLYLLFSPNDALDLDTYVLNTEAHPLRRPVPLG